MLTKKDRRIVGDKVALCAIARNENNYIREWDALDDALYKEWFIDSKRG